MGLQEEYPVQAVWANTDSQGNGERHVELALVSLVLVVLLIAGGWQTLNHSCVPIDPLLPVRHRPGEAR